VLDALRRAAGAPVSFAELREAGVELPASVVSELELAGVAVQRCFGEERGFVGVRLDPASERAMRTTPDTPERRMPTEPEPEPEPEPEAESEWTRVPMGTRGVVTLTALLAALVLTAAFVAIVSQGGGRRAPVPIAKRAHPRVATAASGTRLPTTRRPTHATPGVPASPLLATELEAHGHNLLEAGRYGDAIPVLKRAMLATGENVGACLQPASTTCLTYAYALYDLGRAERLAGEPQAAVPILERRLQIDNQRSTVVAQLQLARQRIG
jgi:hypothetical protein